MRAVIACAALLCLRWAADARDLPLIDTGPPLILRLEGAFAPDRERAGERADAVSMRLGDRTRWFAAITARTVGGDHPLSGRAVLNLLAPLQPNLIIVGDERLQRKLDGVPDGAPVVMEGLVNRGSRTCLLRTVEAPTDDERR